MARELQALNGRFPPNAPIPGRGLPHPEILQIPTRQVRLVRAAGAFAASLAAAGALALGPAVVVAALGGGAPVLEAPSAVPEQPIPVALSAREPFLRRMLRRSSNDVRARTTVVVAGATGAPRGRDDAALMPCRAPGTGNGASVRAARRLLQWRPPSSEVLALSRRPRPPPVAGAATPHRFVALIAFTPAPSPPVRWRRPVFSSPRV